MPQTTALKGVGFVLCSLLLAAVVAGCAADAAAGEQATPGATPTEYWFAHWEAQGEVIYEANCATCHGFEGEGQGDIFPPLANNDVVRGAEGTVIVLPMYGRGAMPGFSSLLTDEEMAMVLSYIRTRWGNNAEPISPAQIAPFRQPDIDPPLEPILGGAA